MANQLDRAIAKVRATRGVSQAEKRAIIQQLRRDANPNTGNLGAADRTRMNQALAQARGEQPTQATNPVVDDEVIVTNPGEDVDPPQRQNAPMPTSPPPEGYSWQPVIGEGGFITSWQAAPIPGYQPPAPDTTEQDRQGAEEFLRDLLNRFGLDSLASEVGKLIRQWGVNSDVIAIKLKETAPYRERFKGNLDRTKNGLNMLTEAEYLATEDAIATRMRLRGMGASFQSRDYIGSLIAQDVSAAEVDDRLNQAQRVLDNADPMVVDSLRRLYGASIGDLYGYVLDADTALGDIERKVSAGITARVAEQSGLSIGRSLSEQIGQMTGGNEQALRPTFQRAGALAESTRRLAALEGVDDITDEDVVEGELGYNQESRNQVRRLQSRERARFSGQSGAFRGTLSGNSAY